jgi:hypothetical protein
MVAGSDSVSESESSGVILYDINTYTHPNWNSEINLNKVCNFKINYKNQFFFYLICFIIGIECLCKVPEKSGQSIQ